MPGQLLTFTINQGTSKLKASKDLLEAQQTLLETQQKLIEANAKLTKDKTDAGIQEQLDAIKKKLNL